MSKIIPAIIPKSFEDLRNTLAVVQSFTNEVQVDVVDGKFVPFTSWPYGEPEAIEQLATFADDFAIEVDLMVEAPETVINQYVAAGVKRVVVHMESTHHLSEIIEHRHAHDYRLGFSIHNDTALEILMRRIEAIDFVQLMGIARIGSQGQPFDGRVLDRVMKLRHLYPDLEISIDGSVNGETLSKLAHAGANRFVSGSAILKADDPTRAFHELEKIVVQAK